jgi:hypothetical protein
MPWEHWQPGDEVNTSAWMRATSPGGAAGMEGKPLWSGELGHGVRPAQAGQSDPAAADVAAPHDHSVRGLAANALRAIGVAAQPIPRDPSRDDGRRSAVSKARAAVGRRRGA